jgi:hypothetical protein
MNWSAVTPQMIQDANEVVELVLSDMGIPKFKPSLLMAFYLCERYGNDLPVFEDIPGVDQGQCYCGGDLDGLILIDTSVKGRAKSSIIAHELAHRMCLCSDRYEFLNRPRYAHYNRKDFHELIATGVEFVWRRLASGNMKRKKRMDH